MIYTICVFVIYTSVLVFVIYTNLFLVYITLTPEEFPGQAKASTWEQIVHVHLSHACYSLLENVSDVFVFTKNDDVFCLVTV